MDIAGKLHAFPCLAARMPSFDGFYIGSIGQALTAQRALHVVCAACDAVEDPADAPHQTRRSPLHIIERLPFALHGRAAKRRLHRFERRRLTAPIGAGSGGRLSAV